MLYSAPFTIQRLCELMTEPGKHYRRTDKFLRGIEKVCKSPIKNVLTFKMILKSQIQVFLQLKLLEFDDPLQFPTKSSSFK